LAQGRIEPVHQQKFIDDAVAHQWAQYPFCGVIWIWS